MIYKGLEFYSVAELLPCPSSQALMFTRIPDALRLQLNESAQRNALQTTGCEARFNLKSEQARFVLQSVEGRSIAEVYQGTFFVGWHVVTTEPTEIVVELPPEIEELAQLSREQHLLYDARMTRVILPWRPPAMLLDVEGQFELPTADQVPTTRLLSYGSSITHGNSAVRPTGCYAARTASLLGMELVNMGFGGGAYLEPQIADYIAERSDWDLATMELGINIIASIDVDEFRRRVAYFIPRIAQAHPNKWIFCMDLFTSYWDWRGPDKLRAFRQVVRDQVAALDMPRLVYVPATDVLPSAAGLAADLVHPSPAGMEQMAHNLSAIMARTMAG